MSAHVVVDPAFAGPTACFSVFADADPGVMPRVLQEFAKRGLIPSRWYSTVGGRQARELQIDIQVADLDAVLRERIADDLRQVVMVGTVLTAEKRPALIA